MPALPNRDKHETALATALAKFHSQLLSDLAKQLGEPPSYDRISADLWESMQSGYTAILTPALEAVYRIAATAMSETVSVVRIDWPMLDATAAAWAEAYVSTLVTDMIANRQTFTRETVERGNAEAWDADTLASHLASVYGTARAALIAITEITTANSAGERGFRDWLRTFSPARLVGIWVTEHDAAVCTICAPLDGLIEYIDWTTPPPLHGGCRCHVIYETVNAEDVVQ